jgi:hypothetical protein
MQYLAVSVDVFHALVMILWIAGLPLLFWHRYPTLSKAYFWFALVFIVINQVSHYLLGQCILTSVASYCYSKAAGPSTNEWFSVRFAYFIFGLTPSHRGIKVATEILIAIAAMGGLYSMYRKKTSCHPA